MNFECTGCGKCCSGPPGYVWITQTEIDEIAKLLNIPPAQFIKKYTRQVGARLSLLEIQKEGEYHCIFLKGNRCSVYEGRPSQCRTFPWWPNHIKNKESWKALAAECEGIHENAHLVSEEIINSCLNK